MRSKRLATCDPWELDKAEHAVKTYLPEVKNDIPPRIRFKDFHAVFDVPCWVTFDCETYREGDSNARVASFAYAAMGSDVYTVPPEHRYRMFLDEGGSHVGCVVRGIIRSLMELWADLQLKSQYAPKHALSPYEEERFLEAEVCNLCGRKDELVREHCHFTGAYRGAACKSCNARLVLQRPTRPATPSVPRAQLQRLRQRSGDPRPSGTQGRVRLRHHAHQPPRRGFVAPSARSSSATPCASSAGA